MAFRIHTRSRQNQCGPFVFAGPLDESSGWLQVIDEPVGTEHSAMIPVQFEAAREPASADLFQSSSPEPRMLPQIFFAQRQPACGTADSRRMA